MKKLKITTANLIYILEGAPSFVFTVSLDYFLIKEISFTATQLSIKNLLMLIELDEDNEKLSNLVLPHLGKICNITLE